MADDRKRYRGEPVLDSHWDPPELSANNTYSTTIRINLYGSWGVEKPREVTLSVYREGEKPKPEKLVRIQRGYGTFPVTGLLPGHHYHVVAYIGDRPPVHSMIIVPDLPKPKRPEEEALELEQVQLKRAQVSSEHRKLVAGEKTPTPDEKKIAEIKTQTELVKAKRELEKVKQEEIPKPKRPTREEKRTAALKARLERVTAEQELERAEQKGAVLEANKDLDADIVQSRLKVEQAKVAQELKKATHEEPEKEALEKERTQLERARVSQELKEVTQGKPKLPKKLYVTFSGLEGRQKLFISVEADDGSLMSGFVGLVVDDDKERVFTTDANGQASFQTNFREEDRYFEVRAGNEHDLIWRGVLVGPSLTRRKRTGAKRRPKQEDNHAR